MTIPSNVTRNSYTGTGITGPYPVTFKFFEDADLRVTVADTNGVETVKTLTTDYTVTGAGEQAGGSITFTAAVTNGYSIVIEPKADLTQDTDIKNEGGNLRESIEDRFDRLCREDQVQQNLIDRSIKVQTTDLGSVDSVLPPREAGALIGWNDTGTGFANRSASLLAQDAPVTATGSTTARWLSDRFAETINVRDFGAIGDGVTDDTAAIQAAIDHAASMFSEVSFPPAGDTYTPPIVLIPSGAYRLTNTLNVYVGQTIKGSSGVAYTVEATRLIMDTAGGTVNQNKHIFNVTRTFASVLRSNYAVVTIEDIGFWITNPGSTITARGGTAWTVDGSGIGDGGTGCCIYFGEPTIDARVKRCNFYSVPNAAVYFAGTTGNAEIHECEFDTSTIGIRAASSDLLLRIHCNEFYSGSFHIHINNCTGKVSASANELEFNSRVYVGGTARLSEFHFASNRSDGSGSAANCLEIASADVVCIAANHLGLSTQSTVVVTDAIGGVISGNTFVDSGFNATIVNTPADPGAIKLVGCRGVAVSGNSIVTPGAGTFGGYGIFVLDGTATSRCVISGNHVSGSYTGGAYRSQGRYINVADGDTVSNNNVGVSSRADTRDFKTPSGASIKSFGNLFTVTGAVSVDLSPGVDARVSVMANAVSSVGQYHFDIIVSKSPSDAVYRIVEVSKNGVAAAGAGPHTISAGNTLTFSISGSSLVITAAITTDPILSTWVANTVIY